MPPTAPAARRRGATMFGFCGVDGVGRLWKEEERRTVALVARRTGGRCTRNPT